MIFKSHLLFAIFTSMFFVSLSTSAATVDVNFNAEVYHLEDPNNVLGSMLGLSIGVGDIFNTGYTMDSNPLYGSTGSSNPAVGEDQNYWVEGITTYAIFGGTSYVAGDQTASGSMYIGNDVLDQGSGLIVDAYQVYANFSQWPVGMGIILFNESATRLVDTSFFVNDSLTGWDNAVFFMTGPELFMLADMTVVPIPTAIWLFGSGLVGLIGIARRKKA